MFALLLACEAEPEPAPSGDTGDTAAPAAEVRGGAEADVVYDPDQLHEVVVTLDPDDWAELRVQERNFYDLFDEGCMDGPWGSPYTWFEAQVSVDGEELGAVAVRKKGLLGSVTADRPSLRVDVDRFQPDARFHGLKKLVLNNGNQDPSRLRTCLAHDFYADAGLVAPRCALAHVVVNGEDLGVYAQTEAIDEELVARREGAFPATMYEGTLSDFREGWLATFEAEADGADGADLQRVVDALAADDDALLAELGAVLDLDAWFRFWVAESLSGHWDGYNGNTNNFYVYGDADDGRLRFIASGPDSVWDSRQPFGAGAPLWVATTSALSNRLIAHPEGKARFVAEMERQLAQVWAPDERLARLDAWAELVRPVDTTAQRDGIEALRSIVAQRADDVEATYGGRVQPAPLREGLCWTDVGEVRVDFSTAFGSYPDGDVFLGGSAAPYYEINGAEYVALESGASAGWVSDPGGEVMWLVISRIAEETWLAPYVTVDPEVFAAGGDIPIDGVHAMALLMYNSPDTNGQWATAAYLGNGTLHLDEAGIDPDAPVRGRLDVKVLGQAE